MEVDPQMVAFNARILDYCDIVLAEFWRSRGVAFTGPDAFEVHVVRANIEYLKPLRFDEEIDGLMRVARFGRSSMTTIAEFYGLGPDDIRGRVELVQVHVDLNTGRPVNIPDLIREKLSDPPAEQQRGPATGSMVLLHCP
jgi:acyl-CoA thioester hydrolase